MRPFSLQDFTTLKKIVGLSLPTAFSALLSIVVDLYVTRLLGSQDTLNYYLLSLYWPINYLLVAVMESCRACALFLSASLSESKTHALLGSQLFLLMLYGLLLLAVFWVGFEYAYPFLTPLLKIAPHQQYPFKIWVDLTLALFYFRYAGTLLIGALYGLGNIRIALLLALASAFFTLAFTHFLIPLVKPSMNAQPYAFALSAFITGSIAISILKKQPQMAPIFWLDVKNNFFRFLTQVLRFSSPIFISYWIIFFSLFLLNVIIAPFGPSVVAGFGIAYRLQTLIILPGIALGIATGIFMNQKKRYTSTFELNHFLRVSVLFSLGLYLLIACLVFTFRIPFMHYFAPDSDMNRWGIRYFYYVAPSYVGMGPLLVLLTAMEQIGLSLRSLFFNIVYFSAILCAGGCLIRTFHDISYLYYTISAVNFMSIGLLFYACFLYPQPFIPRIEFFNFIPFKKA